MSVRSITIADIAREAGVSKTAASFYINGKAKMYNLAESTCSRIEEVIRKHNFSPNIHAKAINSGKTSLIGVVVGAIERSFWTEIISGIEDAIEKYQYHMLLTVSHYNPEREGKLLEFLDKKGVDGYIYSPVVTASGIPNSGLVYDMAGRKPLVSITHPLENLPGVYNDNYQGGRIAAEYLHQNGHTKVAVLGGGSYHKRLQGVKDYFNENNIVPTLFDNAANFFKRVREFTAVFCFSDYFVLEIYGIAKDVGIKIPQDLSVVGYDNMDFVKLINPTPVTIHQYKSEIGFAAGNLLMKIINGEKLDSKEIKFIPKLIEGKSVRNLKINYKENAV